jgi:hypothetical protein
MVGSPSLTIQHCKPMPRHPLLLLTLAAAALVAGCGSAAPEPASSNTDVNTLLSDTFRNVSKIKSANLSAKLAIEGGGQSVGATLSGPFESRGEGKLPKLQLDATLDSGGQSFTAGATWTGDKGFVNVQGTQYELSGLVAKQFEAGYEESLKKASQQGAGNPGALLGIDFSKWLKNGQNAGEAKVGDTDTIKLTGEADVAQVVDDLQKVAAKASSLNLPGSTQVPDKITPEQRQQIVDAVKKFAIEVYTGKEDRILRRLVVDADLQDPAAKSASHVSFELTLDNVGDSQTITEPKNAKPFSELLKMTDELKGLGLGALGGTSSAGGSSGSSTTEAAPNDKIEKYAKCVTDAKGDQAKAQKCADLLGG